MIRNAKPAVYDAISILLVSFLLTAASCHSRSNTSSSASDTAATPVQQGVKKIDSMHEEVMNSIGPLRRLEDSIRGKIKATAARGADTVALSRVANALNSCDTSMFGWMGQYDTHLKGKNDSEKVVYLHDQMGKLSRLDATMDSTMKEARMQLR